MTIKELQKFGLEKLYGHVLNPDFESDLLLAHILKKDRGFLYGHPHTKISNAQLSMFKKLVLKRRKGEPFAYLIGETEFFESKIKVNKDVLIPRPDTEHLVEQAIGKMQNGKFKTVVDIGTGSGAIVISIAKAIEKNQSSKIKVQNYFGTDISEKALKVAKLNAKNITPKSKIKFLRGDLLKPLKKISHPLLVISNPPYLTEKVSKKSHLKHEPFVALSGGKSGLDLISKLIEQFSQIAKPKDALLLEIGHDQAKRVTKLVQKDLLGAKVEIKKDYAGFDRVVLITL